MGEGIWAAVNREVAAVATVAAWLLGFVEFDDIRPGECSYKMDVNFYYVYIFFCQINLITFLYIIYSILSYAFIVIC